MPLRIIWEVAMYKRILIGLMSRSRVCRLIISTYLFWRGDTLVYDYAVNVGREGRRDVLLDLARAARWANDEMGMRLVRAIVAASFPDSLDYLPSPIIWNERR